MKNRAIAPLPFSLMCICVLVSVPVLAQEDCGLADFQLSTSLAPFGAELAGTETVYYDPGQQTYVFNYNNEVEYQLDVGDADVQQGIMKVFERYVNYYPITGAGTRYRTPSGTYIGPESLKSYSHLTGHSLCEDNVVALYYTDTYPGRASPNYKVYTFELRGETLIIHVFSDDQDTDPNGNYAGFELKPFSASNAYSSLRKIDIPYLYQIPVFLMDNEVYQTIYYDMEKSLSTGMFTASDPNYPLYYPFDDGSINPLEETFYLTVSPDIYDTFPRSRNPGSAYKDELNDRVVLDVWDNLPSEMAWYSRGYPQNQAYNKTREFIGRLNDLGFTDLAIIFHVWQKNGYDYRLPEHYPAGNYYGTDEDFKGLIDSSISKGYLFALHENYEEIGVDSIYWNQPNLDDLAYDRDMSMREGYTVYESYALASNEQQKYASYESSEIEDNYGTNAGYIDVVPGGLAYRYISYKKSVNQGSLSVMQSIQNIRDHFSAQQDRYDGPLFGETRRDASSLYYLGDVDATEAEVFQGSGKCGAQTDTIPDFELLTVHPTTLNHGMGYYCRYFDTGCFQDWDLDPNSIDVYEYLADQIAYGHAGFLGSCYDQTKLDQVSGERLYVLNYYMAQSLQSQYAPASMEDVLYLDGTKMVNLSEAIKSDLDLSGPGLYIGYDNGLEMFVNRQGQNWAVIINESHEQGQDGWYLQEHLNFEEGDHDLVWDPMGWKGKNEFSMIMGSYMHPDGGSILRKWVSSEYGIADISGYVYDSDTICGDGVLVRVFKNDLLIWAKDLDGTSSDIEYINVNDMDVSPGDEFSFVVDQKSNSYCDSTILYPVIGLNGRDITIRDVKGIYLPPNGWVVHNPNNGFLEYSALLGCPYDCYRVDFVDSDDYTFVNSGGTQTSLESSRGVITTSGMEVIKSDGHAVTCDDQGCLAVCNSNGICDAEETIDSCPDDCTHVSCYDGTADGSCSTRYVNLYCNDGSLEYNCSMCGCHESDTDQNGVISIKELNSYIARWYISREDVAMGGMMEAIEVWIHQLR